MPICYLIGFVCGPRLRYLETVNRYISEIPGLKPSIPCSLGVVSEGKFLFLSGFGPYDFSLGRFNLGTVSQQTELALLALERVMHEANAKKENVVSCKIYLQRLTETTFAEMNGAYAKFFGDHRPARTTIGCQLLNIDVEIDCIVKIP